MSEFQKMNFFLQAVIHLSIKYFRVLIVPDTLPRKDNYFSLLQNSLKHGELATNNDKCKECYKRRSTRFYINFSKRDLYLIWGG